MLLEPSELHTVKCKTAKKDSTKWTTAAEICNLTVWPDMEHEDARKLVAFGYQVCGIGPLEAEEKSKVTQLLNECLGNKFDEIRE
jgi:hypothetical protein